MCLFELPQLYGAQNYLVHMPEGVVDIIENDAEFVKRSQNCDSDVANLCNCLIEENGYIKDKDPYNALNLYTKLRVAVNRLLED